MYSREMSVIDVPWCHAGVLVRGPGVLGSGPAGAKTFLSSGDHCFPLVHVPSPAYPSAPKAVEKRARAPGGTEYGFASPESVPADAGSPAIMSTNTNSNLSYLFHGSIPVHRTPHLALDHPYGSPAHQGSSMTP